MIITKYLIATAAIVVIAAAQDRPQFEVASIKPNHSGMMGVRLMMQPGGRFKGDNVTAKFLIEFAYNIKTPQISGGPDWLNSEHFDIEAEPEAGGLANLSPEDQNKQMRLMMQSLLADRFKLTVRHESKELPIYVLVVGKNGPKIQPSKDQSPPPPFKGEGGARVPGGPGGPGGPVPRGMARMGRGELNFNGVPINMLSDSLSRLLGRPVIDKTGLQGRFDVELKWTPDASEGGMLPGGGPGPEAPPPPDPSGPNIFTALQEQLGLKLESQKGPVDTLVIERVEKPTEN